jgi:DNA-binding response OmpR family regulator
MAAGNVLVDREGMKARVSGAELPLTATELRLLGILMRQRGQTVTRTQLLDKLWDAKGEFVDDNTLSVHIRHLREKLAASGADCVISTVRGLGYTLEVEG